MCVQQSKRPKNVSVVNGESRRSDVKPSNLCIFNSKISKHFLKIKLFIIVVQSLLSKRKENKNPFSILTSQTHWAPDQRNQRKTSTHIFGISIRTNSDNHFAWTSVIFELRKTLCERRKKKNGYEHRLRKKIYFFGEFVTNRNNLHNCFNSVCDKLELR